VQDPVALDAESEPEPDVAVVPGRGHKGSLYARVGIADYWIVNLVDDVPDVYRGPAPDRSAEFGWRYLDVQALRPGTAIAPLARPDVTVAVAERLP